MTDDEQRDPDEEARRLLETAFLTLEKKAQADDALSGQLHRLFGIPAVSAAIGWDLDGPSAVRAVAVSDFLNAARAAQPGPGTREQLEEIIENTRLLDGNGFFAQHEDAWRRGRETEKGGEE